MLPFMMSFEKYRELLEGPSHILGRMKGIWNYLSGAFHDDKKLLKKIQKTKTVERYQQLSQDIFSQERLRRENT